MPIEDVAATVAKESMKALTIAIDALRITLKTTIDLGDTTQKISLALGKTFKETNETLGPTMKGLRGDLNERFRASIAGMEAGLQGNTAGIARLINQQRLTGTQSANTAKAFATLEAGLGLSREETNNLAKSLIITGEEWEVSTDKLVSTIDAMKDKLPWMQLAGMGGEVVGAMTDLKAELPSAMHDHLDKAMNMIFDPAIDNLGKLALMGMEGVRERLIAEKDQKVQVEILKEALSGATDRIKDMAGGSEDFYAQLGVTKDLFGDTGASMFLVSENFGKRVKEAATESDKYAEIMKTLTSEILEPLQHALINGLYPIILKLVPALRGFTIFVFEMGLIILNALDPIFKEMQAIFNFLKKDAYSLDAAIGALVISAKILNGAMAVFVAVFRVVSTGIINRLIRILEPVLTLTGLFGFMREEITGFLKALHNWGSFFSFFRSTEESDEIREKKSAGSTGNMLLGDIVKEMKKAFEEQKKSAEGIESIDGKTIDPNKPTSAYLDATANELGRAVEAVIGYEGTSPDEEYLRDIRDFSQMTVEALQNPSTATGITVTPGS